MNVKMQKVAETLPPAPQTLLAHSWQKCLEAGINIPQEEFVFIHRAMIDYLNTTGEGKKVMLRILKADITEACYTKQYYQSGQVGDPEKALDYRGLIEYKGWVYRGKAVPYSAVDIHDAMEKVHCDHCSGLFPKSYCNQTVRIVLGGKEYMENVCNHCRLFSEDPKVRETASSKTCGHCKVYTCSYNPERDYMTKREFPKEKPLHIEVQGDPEPTMALKTTHKPQTASERYSAIW